MASTKEEKAMSNQKSSKISTKTIVGMGLLTAIVIVLQALAISIRFGVFTITLVLAPIIVGAALYGIWAGAWLGFVFGVVVLLTDAGTFLAINVPGTIVTCILKGVAAGVVAAIIYKALAKKNQILAVILAGIGAPVANTGIFLLGCLIFFLDTIKVWAGDTSVGVFMITGFVGLNFVVELIINLVLSSVIVRILHIAFKGNLTD